MSGTIRIMTWNVHGTFSLNPDFDLEGVCSIIESTSFCGKALTMSVPTAVGAMQLTITPSFARSLPMDLVRPMTAAFDVE